MSNKVTSLKLFSQAHKAKFLLESIKVGDEFILMYRKHGDGFKAPLVHGHCMVPLALHAAHILASGLPRDALISLRDSIDKQIGTMQ